MMKKIVLSISLFFAGLISMATPAPTDEGMWLPLLLKDMDWKQLKKMGLTLKPGDIYNAEKASLKDAIVWFGGFCTGEIISDKGLVVTNHHCGYEQITKLSTPDDNILDDGFFAKSLKEERPAKGLWVARLVRMEDVTGNIMPAIQGLEGEDRDKLIKHLSDSLSAAAQQDNHYQAAVKGFFNENQYYLFVMERYLDVRLVGTPTQSVGKFGGDTDNWMWPRHTGDFSMFRIYADSNNMPATYSPNNVPYQPKHHLPVSIKGIEEGDFAMVFGFPGRTNRYATSYELQLQVEKTNPAFIKLRDARLKIMMDEMKKDEQVRLDLSSDYARIANYWKNYIGMNEQIKRLKVIEQRRELEQKFAEWAKDKPEYAGILANLEKAYADYEEAAIHNTYRREGLQGSNAFTYATYFTALDQHWKDGKKEDAEQYLGRLKSFLGPRIGTMNKTVDQNILAATMAMYYYDIPKDQQAPYFNTIIKEYGEASPETAFRNYAREAFAKSIFTDSARLYDFFENPSQEALQNDILFKFASAYNESLAKYDEVSEKMSEVKAREMRKYVEGLMQMDKNLVMYPDANSTLRISFGKVSAYEPKDGVKYQYYTTGAGILEKYVPGDYEFDVPAKLIDLLKKEDFGQYAMKNGELPVNFITDNDITGGNSGSPVINGKGELIGLAFDGNWEAMSGDIVFDPKYKRCINVDIRYVLFIIEKYHGATNIIEELDLKK